MQSKKCLSLSVRVLYILCISDKSKHGKSTFVFIPFAMANLSFSVNISFMISLILPPL